MDFVDLCGIQPTPTIVTMRSFCISIGLALSLCSGALSKSKAAIDVFRRAEALKPGLVERQPELPYHPKLDKRASPYLTDATQSMSSKKSVGYCC